MMKQIRAIFAYMVEILVTTPTRYTYNRKIPKIVSEIEPSYAQARVLDIGCGDGRYSKLFGRYRYTGIDIGDYDFNRTLIENASFCRASVEALPFRDQTFDMVFSSFMIEHVGDITEILASIRETLRPGGTLFLSTGTRCAAIVGEMHRLFWRTADESVGQAHHYFDVGRLIQLHERAGFENVRARYVSGPLALGVEIVTRFLRLLSMKIRGEQYLHGRNSDATSDPTIERRRSRVHRLWQLSVPIRFILKWTFTELAFWIDPLFLPLRCSKLVVITATSSDTVDAGARRTDRATRMQTGSD